MEQESVTGAKLPSVMALAYLGDAVQSLYVREMLVRRGISKSGELNREALRYVTAPAQAKMAERLLPLLREDEADVFRRAGNHHLQRPKNASGADYRSATGLEAVFGMLRYVGREERLAELLALAHEEEK